MQNTDQVLFTILWKELYVSKLIMMLVVTLFGFIIGVIVARPKKKKQVIQNADVPLEVTQSEDKDYIEMPKKQGLSDEDRDYLN